MDKKILICCLSCCAKHLFHKDGRARNLERCNNYNWFCMLAGSCRLLERLTPAWGSIDQSKKVELGRLPGFYKSEQVLFDRLKEEEDDVLDIFQFADPRQCPRCKCKPKSEYEKAPEEEGEKARKTGGFQSANVNKRSGQRPSLTELQKASTRLFFDFRDALMRSGDPDGSIDSLLAEVL